MPTKNNNIIDNMSINSALLNEQFEQCRPYVISELNVDAKVVGPGYQIEVRRYFWEQALQPTPFEIDVYYLELSLNPRPGGSQISYMNLSNPSSYTVTGNCSFIPAGKRTMMCPPKGRQLVIGCMFDKTLFDPFVDWQWTPLEMAACINIQNIHIRTALIQLSQELMNPGFESSQLIEVLFRYLLIELSRHFKAVRNASKDFAGKLSTHQLHIIDSCINESQGFFPQTSFLAEKCGISNRHLARMFKHTTGKTITEYITDIRINKAKNKLLNSAEPVKKIAADCGFKSQSAFSQAFKSATGLAPSKFRLS